GRWAKLRELLADPVAVVTAMGGLQGNQVYFTLTHELIALLGVGKRDHEVVLPPKQEGAHLPVERILIDGQDGRQSPDYRPGLRSATCGSRVKCAACTQVRESNRCALAAIGGPILPETNIHQIGMRGTDNICSLVPCP